MSGREGVTDAELFRRLIGPVKEVTKAIGALGEAAEEVAFLPLDSWDGWTREDFHIFADAALDPEFDLDALVAVEEYYNVK